MNRLIVSAPFGNWFTREGVTSTVGTYTWKKRAGPLGRAWRVLSTVRYSPFTQAWVNRLGLPSPALDTAANVGGKIVSVRGFSALEWRFLVTACLRMAPEAVEFNLSCPNAQAADLRDVEQSIDYALRRGLRVIAKLPPVRWMSLAEPLFDRGVRLFHCCNTIPTEKGGVSGKPLKSFSLWATQDVKQRWGDDVTVVGGGGVTCLGDVKDFVAAGADHVAVASMLFNPLNWGKLRQFRDFLNEQFSPGESRV